MVVQLIMVKVFIFTYDIRHRELSGIWGFPGVWWENIPIRMLYSVERCGHQPRPLVVDSKKNSHTKHQQLVFDTSRYLDT